jgi:hypothetical protein
MTRVDLPRTDPYWAEQRLMDNKPLTADELKSNVTQTDAMNTTLNILHKPVAKGDYKAANQKAADLQRHFESLSPETKQFLYNQLQSHMSKGVVDSEIAGQFRYYLERGQRDKLLKTLNPDHQKDQIHKYTISDAREKAAKNVEMNMGGAAQMRKLEQEMEELRKNQQEIINNIRS